MSDRYTPPAPNRGLTRQGYALLYALWTETPPGQTGHRPSIEGRLRLEGAQWAGMSAQDVLAELRGVNLCGPDGRLTERGRGAALTVLFQPQPLPEW